MLFEVLCSIVLTCILQLGLLALAREKPLEARADFESALTYCPDHAAATVGLSNILLDIYSEKLLPLATNPNLPGSDSATEIAASRNPESLLPALPLGLGPSKTAVPSTKFKTSDDDDSLPAPYKATRLPLVDRLAARDRAYTLLSGLTRLGSAWDDSEAWFALARAHEESGQPDKAKEVLWWCVELEESTGIRNWRSLGSGGYII